MKTDRADIVVYTEAWDGDHSAESVEQATSQLRCRVTLNGVEIPVAGIEVKTEHGDFLEARLKFWPSQLRFVSLLENEMHADELPVACRTRWHRR